MNKTITRQGVTALFSFPIVMTGVYLSLERIRRPNLIELMMIVKELNCELQTAHNAPVKKVSKYGITANLTNGFCQ